MDNNKKAMCLLMNDLHVDKDNIPEFEKNWKEALKLALSLNLKYIIIGGDIFTSRASQPLSTLLAVKNMFDSLAKHFDVRVIEGNHDLVNHEESEGYCSMYNDIKNVTVYGEGEVLRDLDTDFTLAMISYFPEDGSFLEHLNHIESLVDWKHYSLKYLYIHEGIKGGVKDNKATELDASVFSKWDKVFVGHYHNRCKIGKNIEYIGASRQHNFGEDSDKGYTVIYDDGSVDFYKNKVNKKYITYEFGYDEYMKADVKDIIENCIVDNCNCRIKVKCTHEESNNINIQHLLSSGASKVEIELPDEHMNNSTSENIETHFDKDSILKSYDDFCEENNIKDKELGLKYLESI